MIVRFDEQRRKSTPSDPEYDRFASEFDTRTDSRRNYTRAKVIDMVFFVEGGEGPVA